MVFYFSLKTKSSVALSLLRRADAESINQAQPTKRSHWKLFFHTYIYVYSFVFVFLIIALSMERTWLTFHCWLYSVQLCMWWIKILNLFTWLSDLSPHVLCFPQLWVKSDRLCSARCMKQTLWSSADHALAQVRPCQIFSHTFSKQWSKMQSQSRALLSIFNYYYYYCVFGECPKLPYQNSPFMVLK